MTYLVSIFPAQAKMSIAMPKTILSPDHILESSGEPSTLGLSVTISAESFTATLALGLKFVATFFAFCEAIDFALPITVVNRSWFTFLDLLAMCPRSTSLPSVVVSFS
ncbi:MAG TPA: hypothetical protein VKA87_02755 [Nitrososphaeraceae archaeon]|nr:hypothetical protein [Nitrososphaeraceae archaeon]